MDAGGRRRQEQAVEEARSRDGQDVRYAARGHAYRDVGGRPRRERAVEAVDGVWNEGREKSWRDLFRASYIQERE